MTSPVFDPEKLVEFIEELHRQGFIVSTQQYTTAQDLLITLVAEGRAPSDPQNLTTLLAPVFCTSPEEQRIFHKVFKQWLEQQLQREQETIETKDRAGIINPAEVKNVRWNLGRISQPSYVAVGLMLVGVLILFALLRSSRTLSGVVTDEEKKPIQDAQIVAGNQRTVSNAVGQFTLTDVTNVSPLRVVVTHEEHETLIFELNSFDNSPISITLRKRTAVIPTPLPVVQSNPFVLNSQDDTSSEKAATLQRHFKNWPEIYRDVFKLMLVGVTLLPMLYFGVWWLLRLGSLRLTKQSSDEEYLLHSIMVKGAPDQPFRGQTLRRVAQEMRRHRQFGSDEIDPPPTVIATIREGGWFTPIYGLRKEQPEYLALIDRTSLDDHQAHLEDALINQLVNDGVIVERYYFRHSPLTCRRADPKSPHINLQELKALYPNHILLLFSDGDGLINALAEPHRWLDMLADWPVRALLTTKEMADWNYNEWLLSEQGFVVIPASKAGMADLVETIHTGKAARFGANKKGRPFPELLYERPWRWLERHEPEHSIVNLLCFQLRRFLGNEGYYLLGACAVYPMFYWQLTLYLAYKLGGRNDLDDKLRSLVRLPWFRHGSMPDWLRLQLISTLPAKYKELTRRALIELLESSFEKPRNNSFELPYVKGEYRNDDAPDSNGFWNDFIKSAQTWKRKERWQNLIRLQSKQSPLRDYVFLTFMSRLKNQRLALSVPDVLWRIMFPEGQTVLRLRTTVRLLFAILCSVVLVLTLSTYIINVTLPITPLVATRHFDAVYSVRFTPDGTKLASASGDETVKVCQVVSDNYFPVTAWFGLTPQREAVSPDRTLKASVVDDNQIKLSVASTGKELATLAGHSALVYSLAFSPDNTLLASGSVDKSIKVWNLIAGEEPITLKGHSALVYSLAFAFDSRLLTSGSLDGTTKVWDVSTGKELTTRKGHLAPIYSIAISPNAKLLAGNGSDNMIQLWDMSAGKELASLKGHTAPIYAVAFSPDGGSLASGGWDNTIKLWNLSSGDEVVTFYGHSSIVTSVAFSSDGNVLASGSLDNTIKLWDVSARREITTLKGHSKIVYSVAFSPDGTKLASASGDGTIKVWDVGTGKESATLKGHSGPVYSVAFSLDGKILASGSADKTVKLWDLSTGKELATFSGHSGLITSVALSSDGNTMATGSNDRKVLVWDLTDIIK